MAKKAKRDDPHKLIHVLSGTLFGIGIGMLTGFISLQIIYDLLDFAVGASNFGNATDLLSLIGAAFVGLEVGFISGRKLTSFLRPMGEVVSWLIFLPCLALAAFVLREGYLRGFMSLNL